LESYPYISMTEMKIESKLPLNCSIVYLRKLLNYTLQLHRFPVSGFRSPVYLYRFPSSDFRFALKLNSRLEARSSRLSPFPASDFYISHLTSYISHPSSHILPNSLRNIRLNVINVFNTQRYSQQIWIYTCRFLFCFRKLGVRG